MRGRKIVKISVTTFIVIGIRIKKNYVLEKHKKNQKKIREKFRAVKFSLFFLLSFLNRSVEKMFLFAFLCEFLCCLQERKVYMQFVNFNLEFERLKSHLFFSVYANELSGGSLFHSAFRLSIY